MTKNTSLLFLMPLLALALIPTTSSAQDSGGTLVIVVEGSIIAPVPTTYAPQTVAAPATAPILAPAVYEPAYSAPIDAPPRTRRRWGLVGAGAGLALAAYAVNIGGTVLALAWPFSNGHRDQLLFSSFVPVAGPLMQIAFRDEDWQIPFYLVSSALQIAGFAMAFAGTFSTQVIDEGTASLSLMPYASGDGMGLLAGGTF